jgi:hypothetical protein
MSRPPGADSKTTSTGLARQIPTNSCKIRNPRRNKKGGEVEKTAENSASEKA